MRNQKFILYDLLRNTRSGRRSGSMELRETQEDRRGVSSGSKRLAGSGRDTLGTRRFLVALSCLLADFFQDLDRLVRGTQRLYHQHLLATRTT